MACGEAQGWTFCTLAGAFLDLTIALILLCCVVATYIVSNLLSLFGLALPCPCDTGLFGAPGGCTCPLRRGPISRIGSVQTSIRAKPPFDSILTPKVENVERQVEEFCGSSVKSSSLGCSSRYVSASSKRAPGSSGETPSSSGRLSWVVGKRRGGGRGKEEEEDVMRLLEMVLEEEQAARSALYVELEKERSAAASAAEEAMAMIDRLQKEKAVVEMNARQYQRMVEEKSAYDKEEMEVLKEIILKRERELHVLGKEVMTYRKGGVLGAAPRSSLESDDDDTSAMLQEIFNSILNKDKARFDNGNASADRLDVGEEGQSSRLLDGACSRGDARRPDMFACVDSEDRDFQEKGIVVVDEISHKMNDESRGRIFKTPNKVKHGFRCDDAHSVGRNWNDSSASHPEKETFDIHAIGDEIILSGEGNREENVRQIGRALVSSQSYPSFESSSINWRGRDINLRRDNFDDTRIKSSDGFLPRGNRSLDGPVAPSSSINSTSVVENERSSLRTEVEGLRRRLDIIHRGRQELRFSVENLQKEGAHLQLLQEIALQLRQLCRLSEHEQGVRQASLRVPSSQVKSKD